MKITDKNFPAGKFTLAWETEQPEPDLIFILEESVAPEFLFPQEIYRGAARQFEVKQRHPGVYYYRVRAEAGTDYSDWSTGLGVGIPENEELASIPAEEYDSRILLRVQRAMLRMCAARGDLFAVLSMPEHFDESRAFAHLGALKSIKVLPPGRADVDLLKSDGDALSADETKVLSFGAIYYPWLLTNDKEGGKDFRVIPPDGAVCGTFAKRSGERGAWIAPANEAIQGVLGLAKETRRERFPEFQENLINLVRQEPRGLLVLDSDTLANDSEIRQISVRRLLNLLRRLALKHGAEFVFEPNDERFRRQVQRRFAALLDLMFVRGAFAGKTPESSYQVVVSEAVNNIQSIEQGRFIVELKVAPSLPLKFVTVRLVQAGGRSDVTETF